MPRVRCPGVLVGPILAMAACNALQGDHDRVVDAQDAFPPDDAPRLDASGGVLDATNSPDTAESKDANDEPNDGKIPCLGGRENAFLCDDFEGAALGSWWQALKSPAGSAVVDLSPNKHLSGARGLLSGFSQLANGEAKVRWTRGTSGPLALRFSFFLVDDAWNTNQVVPIAALKGSGGTDAVVVFVSTGAGGNGVIEVRIGADTIAVGSATVGGWGCYQVVYNGVNVIAYKGTTEQGAKTFTSGVVGVELGMTWTYGANPNAGKVFYYDDVVVAPAPIPCK